MTKTIKGTTLELYYNPATKMVAISDFHNPHRVPEFNINKIDNIINELELIKKRFKK